MTQSKFANLSNFMSENEVDKFIELPKKLCPEKILHEIPALTLGSEGPALTSIYLVSENLLCDIRTSEVGQHFDFIALSTIKNYRFRLWTHEIKEGDEVKGSYELAQIIFSHEFSVQTVLNFVGSKDDSHAWIKYVTDIIAIKTIL